MRALGVLVAGITVLAIAAACGSSDGSGAMPEDDDSGTVTAAYCTKYCAAQASAGTLQGSRAECLTNCCKDVSGGCPAVDAAADDDTSDDGGTTGDGSTCLNPCNDTCCPTGQGCVEDTSGKKSCVATCFTAADCPGTGCCAPATNRAGNAVGPYICKPNDGKDYDCCVGTFNPCNGSADACCVKDSKGNQFCGRTCTTSPQCGAAHCIGATTVTLSSCNQGLNFCQP